MGGVGLLGMHLPVVRLGFLRRHSSDFRLLLLLRAAHVTANVLRGHDGRVGHVLVCVHGAQLPIPSHNVLGALSVLY